MNSPEMNHLLPSLARLAAAAVAEIAAKMWKKLVDKHGAETAGAIAHALNAMQYAD